MGGDYGQNALFKYIVLCLSHFQEKWDSMTRKWKDNCLLQLVRLFLIDEVRQFVQMAVQCSSNHNIIV